MGKEGRRYLTKFSFKNRKGQKIVGIIENPKGKNLVFIEHGNGAIKEQMQVRFVAKAFLEKDFTVITFDVTNSIGESDGSIEKTNMKNYIYDLVDVIIWASKQSWYEEPFYLAGFSVGAMSCGLYSTKHQKKVKALALLSPVVSGKLDFELISKKELKDWKKTGWKIIESNSKPGIIKRIPWTYVLSKLKYELINKADKMKMKVLLTIGSLDTTTSLQNAMTLHKRLKNSEFHLIKGAPHTSYDKKHLNVVKGIIKNWIERSEKC